MMILASTTALAAPAEGLTVCTGARCWRNGAGRLLAAAQSRDELNARSVGCSGLCPRNAVSVCEGPDCPGPALVLQASDEMEAEQAVQLAAASKVAPRRTRRREYTPERILT